MLLDYIHIENFGPFNGANRVDLSPTADGEKAIVLVGADNGAGKTTLLAALKVCLYGRRASELWEGGLQGYRQFVREKFNNTAFDSGERQIVLETGLRAWVQKIPIQLVVRRSFTLTDNRQFLTDNQESLEIFRDGKAVDRPFGDRLEEDDANQYDEFLRVLIPAHLLITA